MQPANTQARGVNDALCLKIANKYIVKTVIFSSFNDIDLSRNMLANCCMQRCRGKGTMAAVGRGSSGKNAIFSNGPNSTSECFNVLY
jgi:hypothetical protein